MGCGFRGPSEAVVAKGIRFDWNLRSRARWQLYAPSRSAADNANIRQRLSTSRGLMRIGTIGQNRTSKRPMNLCVVELTTTPADEHLNHQGVALRVELSYDKAGCRDGRYWRRSTYAMEWMEHATSPAVRLGMPDPLRQEFALSLWNAISSARISPFAEGQFGYFHPMTFRLKLSSPAFSCDLSWKDELPPEWSALKQAVQVLESIADDGASG